RVLRIPFSKFDIFRSLAFRSGLPPIGPDIDGEVAVARAAVYAAWLAACFVAAAISSAACLGSATVRAIPARVICEVAPVPIFPNAGGETWPALISWEGGLTAALADGSSGDAPVSTV